MKLKALSKILNKAYFQYGDIEVQTMGGKEDYKIKSVCIGEAGDELYIELESIEQ